MADRTWESAAKRLGISKKANLAEVVHTILDRIEGAASESAPNPNARKPRPKPEA